MKKYISILLLIFINFISNAQTKNIYVIIDNKYQKLFQFEKNNNSHSSIKILEYNKRSEGFNEKENTQKDNDIVVVLEQPTETNYYEFESFEKPKEVKSINNLKTYSIEEVSKNIKSIQKIWTDPNYSIIFIEKEGVKYRFWKMNPIFLE